MCIDRANIKKYSNIHDCLFFRSYWTFYHSGKNSSEKNLVVQFISTHFNISVHYNLRQELKITDVGDCDTNLECISTCEGVVMVVEREKKCKC